jgi:hypothetical protein
MALIGHQKISIFRITVPEKCTLSGTLLRKNSNSQDRENMVFNYGMITSIMAYGHRKKIFVICKNHETIKINRMDIHMQLHKISLLSLVAVLFAADTAVAAGGRPRRVSMASRVAADLSATVAELNVVSQDSTFRRVLHAILEHKTPKFEDVLSLERVTTEGRRGYMRTQLEALVRKDVVESTETRLVGGGGLEDLRVHAPVVGTNEKINQLFSRYVLPPYTPEFPDNMYQSLAYALRTVGTADFVEPKYIMATQEELATIMGSRAQKESIEQYFRTHPDVTLVLRATEGDGVLTLNREHIPESLRKLSVIGNDHITSIGDHFLSYHNQLTTLDLSGLSNVTTIGNAFLLYCVKLTTIDLSGFSNVTNIGLCSLSLCHRLDAATETAVAAFKAAVDTRAAAAAHHG